MAAEETGLAAAVAAAVAGAASALGALRNRRRLKGATPSPEPSAMSVRVGALAIRLDHLEQEIVMLKHTLDTKIDRLSESVEELGKASAVAAALLPQVQAQLTELRAELRDRRGARDRG